MINQWGITDKPAKIGLRIFRIAGGSHRPFPLPDNRATGLSSTQLGQALTDKKTRLPDYLEEEMDDDFLLQF
jgi:hypothetical protein